MAALPPIISPTLAAIWRAYERRNDEPARPYLGGSIVGTECERALYYGFRWAAKRTFDGRMFRLFETGQREEERFVADLRAAGVDVWEENPETGKQWAFSDVAGHMRGNLDGICRGVLEAPVAAHVAEFKTHSAKSFADLQKNGVQKSKPLHYAQMQIYMHWTVREWGRKSGCCRALYMAKNKDTDELYLERVEYEQEEAKRLVAKAERVIYAPTPPDRLSDDPSWFQCKFCDFRAVCHEGAMPQVNCRTCAHSTPRNDGDGRWTCDMNGSSDIDTDWQRDAYACHRFIPPLIAARFEQYSFEAPNTVIWIRKDNGAHVRQDDSVPSAELLAHADPAFVALKDALKEKGMLA